MEITPVMTAAGNARPQDAKLLKTCREFESLFLSYMMKTMRETVPESELFGGGEGEKMFKDMRDDAMAQEMAKAGGIGLGSALYKDLQAVAITEER